MLSLRKNLFSLKNNAILHNRVILYFIFLLSLGKMFYLSVERDFVSIAVFALVGLLTSFFSKNMLVILFIALMITTILKHGAGIEGVDDTLDPEDPNEGGEESDPEDLKDGFEGEDEEDIVDEEEDADMENYEGQDEEEEEEEEETTEPFNGDNNNTNTGKRGTATKTTKKKGGIAPKKKNKICIPVISE